MFIGRNPDLTIYGLWTVRQWKDQEELPDNHPDVLAFNNRPVPVNKLAEAVDALLEKEALDPLSPQEVKDYAATLK